MQRQLSVAGIEMTFALNHLAYFLLTHLLLDTIKASTPSRIINVSLDAHSGGKIDFDNLHGERKYDSGAYGNSKLANILFTMKLARRLEGSGVTVNALHPGLLMKIIRVVVPLIARSPEKGAETSIYLASSPTIETVTGKYFHDSKVIPTALQATDTVIAKKLWDVSAEMVHLIDAVPDIA